MRELPRVPGCPGSTRRPRPSAQKRAAASTSETLQSISTAQSREWCMFVPLSRNDLGHCPASRRSRPPEPQGSPLLCLFRLFFPISRGGGCFQLADEAARHLEYLLDRFAKRRLIGLRRRVETAQL